MTDSNPDNPPPAAGGQDQQADRRAKRQKLIEQFGIDPYGRRVDGLIPLGEARSRYDAAADAAAKENPEDDRRAVVKVAGRIRLHRVMGNLIFATLRDFSDDLQVAISKKAVGPDLFKMAKLADLGDIVVVEGPIGSTRTGEVTVWAAGDTGYSLASKSLAPPPAKWEGLTDKELRYRKRYVDLNTNADVMATMLRRSRILKTIRDHLTDRDFVEVETPMMQPIAGGAAARPFVTHHNALDIDLFLRIAPELYLKRLLVGGMPRVFEINRNFRNEGLGPRHNPEFTMLELYQAFGDYNAMMELTETMIHQLAVEIRGSAKLPFGDLEIDYTLPFKRAKYHDLFEQVNQFPADDHDKLVELATTCRIEHKGKDHDLLLNEVWEETVEKTLVQPTFVIDYPASLCPLTRRKADRPDIAERFELFIANMELANAYTELNDPDVQEANFKMQLAGETDEDASFRSMDTDFVEALRVGMPPAGGLGLGIDRLVMLLCNCPSIRDVILFPLMKPTGQDNREDAKDTKADD